MKLVHFYPVTDVLQINFTPVWNSLLMFRECYKNEEEKARKQHCGNYGRLLQVKQETEII